MDGVSLGLGAAGLVLQTFEAVVGCIEAIRNFRDAGDKNATLNCMLFVEQYHLMNWARHCQLQEGKLAQNFSTPEAQAVALMILRNMLQLVADTEKLRTRYGLSFLTIDNDEISPLSQKALSFWTRTQNKTSITNLVRAAPTVMGGGMEMVTLGSEEEIQYYRRAIDKGRTGMNFMKRCRWIVSDSKKFEVMVKTLRDYNLSLDRLLSPGVQQVMRMETNIVLDTPVSELPVLERATIITDPPLSNAANTRARVSRHEPEVLEDTASRNLIPLRNMEIQLSQLEFWPMPSRGSRSRNMATFTPSHGSTREVLVEWRHFDSGLTNFTRQATIQRAGNLAHILSAQPSRDPDNMVRKLDCVGFFVTDEHPERIGYVFDLPQNANPEKPPRSLLELIFDIDTNEDDRVDIDKPPLQERFALGKALCKCIHWLHSSELVHKVIRSDNILFFAREGDREESIRLHEPFVTGFDHSRPDGPNDPTITISASNTEEDRYRHPQYLTSTSRRATKLHDLYSLGLVLLEVAHWANLKSLVSDRTGESILQFLTSGHSPIDELDHLVGSRYRGIVERCIRSRFDVRVGAEGSGGVLQKLFLRQVVTEIIKCNV